MNVEYVEIYSYQVVVYRIEGEKITARVDGVESVYDLSTWVEPATDSETPDPYINDLIIDIKRISGKLHVKLAKYYR